jgi:hypothetical protein
MIFAPFWFSVQAIRQPRRESGGVLACFARAA